MNWRRVTPLVVLTTLLSVSGTASAHVRYVVDSAEDVVSGLRFLIDVLSDPFNAALVGGGALGVAVAALAYLRFRPAARDLAVLRGTLSGYDDLVPWMLRLSVGLPLVGAGFAGYFFTPLVTADLRVLQVAVGFLLLFGLATRVVALVGLLAYLAGLVAEPALLLSGEYVGGFLAIALLGGGRPSADHMLQRIAEDERTLYGRFDPVHRAASWLHARTDPYREYAPTLVRLALGFNFFYLGFTQKLFAPGPALAVVEKYDLTAVVPVDPGLWVVGAGLTEMAVGVALFVGLFTRATAATAFTMLTLTLFGLPDDPVLAHVTLFGMVSMLFITGSGPLAADERLRAAAFGDGSRTGADGETSSASGPNQRV
ncbi:DoxX family membrane protein [Halorussus gelatinilyticus]|uniref:DoxX family membrane protein n=1 Tax=Halorussus gelatinilyticus TaxID=2937524 RepID=A0A8U0II15_9EURY|nr:DoxX family membrane protein [Halorussus gelatinilyticus]UPW00727.1 DoxX family membrane protein [Halorussus gelatinilyticus]